MNQLIDLYKGVRWLAVVSTMILALVILTQPASYTDGFMLSVVLLSAFFVVLGLTSWIGVTLRRRSEAKSGAAYVLRTSLRQGLVAGSAAVLLLTLQLLRVIGLLDALLILVLAVIIELYLHSKTAEAK